MVKNHKLSLIGNRNRNSKPPRDPESEEGVAGALQQHTMIGTTRYLRPDEG